MEPIPLFPTPTHCMSSQGTLVLPPSQPPLPPYQSDTHHSQSHGGPHYPHSPHGHPQQQLYPPSSFQTPAPNPQGSYTPNYAHLLHQPQHESAVTAQRAASQHLSDHHEHHPHYYQEQQQPQQQQQSPKQSQYMLAHEHGPKLSMSQGSAGGLSIAEYNNGGQSGASEEATGAGRKRKKKGDEAHWDLDVPSIPLR